MTREEVREVKTTAADGCALRYTYRPADMLVLSVCVIDAMGRMCPATQKDRADAQWHLENCV